MVHYTVQECTVNVSETSSYKIRSDLTLHVGCKLPKLTKRPFKTFTSLAIGGMLLHLEDPSRGVTPGASQKFENETFPNHFLIGSTTFFSDSIPKRFTHSFLRLSTTILYFTSTCFVHSFRKFSKDSCWHPALSSGIWMGFFFTCKGFQNLNSHSSSLISKESAMYLASGELWATKHCFLLLHPMGLPADRKLYQVVNFRSVISCADLDSSNSLIPNFCLALYSSPKSWVPFNT